MNESEIGILIVRQDKSGHALGVGRVTLDNGHHKWFVYDRESVEHGWHKHCGPYSEMQQAIDWIKEIRQ